jgi:hypothetical protein
MEIPPKNWIRKIVIALEFESQYMLYLSMKEIRSFFTWNPYGLEQAERFEHIVRSFLLKGM